MLIEFRTWWPTCAITGPESTKLWKEYEDLRDSFRVVLFYTDAPAKTLEESVRKSPVFQWKEVWLPPYLVLLDTSGATAKAYGLSTYPTVLLIDPEGKLVDGGGLAMLRSKLTRIRMRRSTPDFFVGIIDFSQGDDAIEYLKRSVDDETLMASGILEELDD